MKLEDIANLVIIRNYAVSAREDRNLFRNDQYSKVSKKIDQMNALLNGVILDFDFSQVGKEEKNSAKSNSQLNLSFDGDEEDDEDLVNRRVEEEKKKLAAKKKTSKKTSKKASKNTS